LSVVERGKYHGGETRVSWVEIMVILVAGLVVTPEVRYLVRRERNQRT
jgi:hypothetical protein